MHRARSKIIKQKQIISNKRNDYHTSSSVLFAQFIARIVAYYYYLIMQIIINSIGERSAQSPPMARDFLHFFFIFFSFLFFLFLEIINNIKYCKYHTLP